MKRLVKKKLIEYVTFHSSCLHPRVKPSTIKSSKHYFLRYFSLKEYSYIYYLMTLKQYLWFMSIATVLCWVAWLFVIFRVDPFFDTGVGFVFFYTTTFLAVLGTTILGSLLVVKFFIHQTRPLYYYVHKTFFIGAGVALCVITLLYLQAAEVLHVWNTVIFFGILLFLLLFRISVRRSQGVSETH